MRAARALRRLLALLALLVPLDAGPPDIDDRTKAETEEVQVVYRHFV
ncbi:hypothetical protein U8607_02840 [Methylobacterium durans]|nr:hypothetical protein [Methylobacterium durans]MEA1831007.1 hypothetical protein [Methylobacterium durans]